MADSVEAKQRFLCLEIMAKGFDPDAFTQWIDQSYENGRRRSSGCDLEKWSQQDLEKAVRDFQQLHAPVVPKEADEVVSPERGSPTAVSENTDVSSLRSVSIPVHNRLRRRPSSCNKSKTEKKKAPACTSTSARNTL